jgi:hypothetical protein
MYIKENKRNSTAAYFDSFHVKIKRLSLKFFIFAILSAHQFTFPSFAQSAQSSYGKDCEDAKNIINAIQADGRISNFELGRSASDLVASCEKFLAESASEIGPLISLSLAHIAHRDLNMARQTLSDLILLEPLNHFGYFLRASAAYSLSKDFTSAQVDADIAIRLAEDAHQRNPKVYPMPPGNYYLLRIALTLELAAESGLRKNSKERILLGLIDELEWLESQSRRTSSAEFLVGLRNVKLRVRDAIAALD